MIGAAREVQDCSVEEASQLLRVPPERVLELAEEGRISRDPHQEDLAFSRREIRELYEASLTHPEILLKDPCSFEDALEQLYLEEDELKMLVSQGDIPCYRVSLEYSPNGRIFEQADVDRLAREFAGELDEATASPDTAQEEAYAALIMPQAPSLIRPRSVRDLELVDEDDSKVVA